MPVRRPGLDLEVLELLEESGRNVERATLLLRDLLVDYPERAGLHRDLVLVEHEGDRISRDGVASLFVNGIDPMVVIRWKEHLRLAGGQRRRLRARGARARGNQPAPAGDG